MSDARTVHARNEHGRVYFTTLHSCNKNTQSLHAQSPTDRPPAYSRVPYHRFVFETMGVD
jgi:hypothetical protein